MSTQMTAEGMGYGALNLVSGKTATVSFPAIKSTSVLFYAHGNPTVGNGTLGSSYTISAGTGFTFSSTTTETTSYYWELII